MEHPPHTPILVRNDQETIRQFQQLMGQFLQTQALVMTAYLQGTSRAGVTPADVLPVAPAMPVRPPLEPSPTAQVQAPPVVMTARPAPAPAQARVPTADSGGNGARPLASSPVAPLAVGVQIERLDLNARAADHAKGSHGDGSRGVNGARNNGAEPMPFADVLREVIQIVSERTGYPEDMLDVDSHIEADLGIDSIKRMEILTAFQQLHGGAASTSLQGSIERLTAQKTLRDTATLLTELLTAQTVAVS